MRHRLLVTGFALLVVGVILLLRFGIETEPVYVADPLSNGCLVAPPPPSPGLPYLPGSCVLSVGEVALWIIIVGGVTAITGLILERRHQPKRSP